MKPVSTITRQKFAKQGVKGLDLLKVIYPEDYQFNFITEDRDVLVESAKDVLPEAAYNKIVLFDLEYGIRPGSCHSTAAYISDNLAKYGVQLCDGYYVHQTDCPWKKRPHTFCKLGERYFDPTIEFVFSPNKISEFTYHCVRVFTPEEYSLFAMAAGYKCNFPIGTSAFTSTIAYENKDTALDDFQIDNDGHFVVVKEPYYNCYSL